MSILAPEKPSRELLDGLSLDAAWERTQMLEVELRRLRGMLRNANDSYTDLGARYGKLVSGVWTAIGKHPEADSGLLADLQALVG